MLIRIKNPELYQAWYDYFSKTMPNEIPAYWRTMAFFNSQKEMALPLGG